MSATTQTTVKNRKVATATATATKNVDATVEGRAPSVKPPFTIGDLRRAIPKHCFERPLTKSFGYLFIDLAAAAAMWYATSYIDVIATPARFGATGAWILSQALWIVYWLIQGNIFTGLWVVGHECGHGGFSDNTMIGDVVGLIVHSCLLVPYFAWQISHRRHHSNTGSVEHDEVFVPSIHPAVTRDQNGNYIMTAPIHHDHDDGVIATMMSTLHRMFFITVMLTLGWPGYLAANLSGNKSYSPDTWVSHFSPSSPIFTTGSDNKDAHNARLIMISDIALVIVVAALVKLCMVYSFMTVLYVYFIPYLYTNLNLVLITYLQHTDISLPHYTNPEWDWLRGALATMDRDYGILNYFHHHIADTHITHHIFSNLPHYHAEEATEALKPILGDYYKMDRTPIAKALWKSYKECDYLKPDSQQPGVWWF